MSRKLPNILVLGDSEIQIPNSTEDPEVDRIVTAAKLFLRSAYEDFGKRLRAPMLSESSTGDFGLRSGHTMARWWPLHRRVMVDGELNFLAIVPMVYNERLVMGEHYSNYERAWCFRREDTHVAIRQLMYWDPNRQDTPDGWFKDVATGRVRPDADPARESSHW